MTDFNEIKRLAAEASDAAERLSAALHRLRNIQPPEWRATIAGEYAAYVTGVADASARTFDHLSAAVGR